MIYRGCARDQDLELKEAKMDQICLRKPQSNQTSKRGRKRPTTALKQGNVAAPYGANLRTHMHKEESPASWHYARASRCYPRALQRWIVILGNFYSLGNFLLYILGFFAN